LPLTPAGALKKHRHNLSGYEQGEILDYPEIYFIGEANHKLMTNPSSNTNNYGFDDERGDYNVMLHDHICYRYEILSPLGKGSFGAVVKCFDHKTNSVTALKIIRNKKRFHHQALVEVKLLQYCKERDPHDQANLVHMQEYFYFRNHLCITFELMSMNLYELIKNNNFQGLSLGLIRRFAVQLLTALRALRKLRIIHCDLKPENILLRQPNKSGIKISDFGSSCFEDERVYTYIQSRFYRSPEVILGLPYDTAIDMWSFGCILAELYTGYPLFPGENEMEQMACIMEVFCVPPKELIDISSRRKMFFNSKLEPRIVPNSRGKKRRPGSKSLANSLKCTDPKFVSFLEGCLQWDPRERFSPEDAIQHEWILEGLQPAPPPPQQSSARSSRASNQAEEKPHSNPHDASSAPKRLPKIAKRKPVAY
jgi:dual specificity tyrosine-phosphorylation-regulated kinase 2/3/4